MVNAGGEIDQPHALQARMPASADDDVIVRGDAKRRGDVDSHKTRRTPLIRAAFWRITVLTKPIASRADSEFLNSRG